MKFNKKLKHTRTNYKYCTKVSIKQFVNQLISQLNIFNYDNNCNYNTDIDILYDYNCTYYKYFLDFVDFVDFVYFVDFVGYILMIMVYNVNLFICLHVCMFCMTNLKTVYINNVTCNTIT